MGAPVKLVYFAWLRERLGRSDETVTLPDGLETIADLLAWQQSRSDQHAHAFENLPIIRVALDQNHAHHDEPIGKPSEIAFFPPMTGG